MKHIFLALLIFAGCASAVDTDYKAFSRLNDCDRVIAEGSAFLDKHQDGKQSRKVAAAVNQCLKKTLFRTNTEQEYQQFIGKYQGNKYATKYVEEAKSKRDRRVIKDEFDAIWKKKTGRLAAFKAFVKKYADNPTATKPYLFNRYPEGLVAEAKYQIKDLEK